MRQNLILLFIVLGIFTSTGNTQNQPNSSDLYGVYSPASESLENTPLPWPDVFDTLLNNAVKFKLNVSSSLWINNEKKLYADLLSAKDYDLLVVPFQTQHFGIDRIGRSLMTADLAYTISASTNLKVADPYLVARALGEGVRRFRKRDVYNLARRLQVDNILWAYVGHDRNYNMKLAIQLQQKEGQSYKLADNKEDYWNWQNIEFSDVELPSQKFHDLLPQILTTTGLAEKISPNAPVNEVAETVTWPESPQTLFQAADSANELQSASHLILLGTLASFHTERASERLFERALLTLNQSGHDHRQARFLKAYALFHLKRRPAALNVLGSTDTSAALALKAVLNGNITAAEEQTLQTTSVFNRFLLAVDISDLRAFYGQPAWAQQASIMAAVNETSDAWKVLIEQRFYDSDSWKIPSPLELKSLLDEAFPIPSYSLQDIVKGQLVVGGEKPGSADLDLVVVRHIRKLLTEQSKQWCCTEAQLKVSHWDYLNLLEALGEASLIKSLYRLYAVQGRPESALERLEKYDPVYAEHPKFASLHARINSALADKSSAEEKEIYSKKVAESALLAAYWEQGQSRLSSSALASLGLPSEDSIHFANAYVRDFPMRPFWHPWENAESSAHSMERTLANLKQALNYSHANFRPAQQLLGLYEGSQQQEQIIKMIEGRFEGSPDKIASVVELKKDEDEHAAVKQLYRQAIAQQPDNWENYSNLGNLLIESEGDYSGAAEVYLSYPGFNADTGENTVGLANNAYESGSRLFWRGITDQASKLYSIAASYDNGSGASMTSRIRLNVLEGNYLEAAKGSLARGQRYPSAYAFRDYLSWVHVLGYSEQAWLGFNQLANQFQNPQVWASALVGQQLKGIDSAAFKQWGMQDHIRNSMFRNDQFILAYTLLWNMVDREPMVDLVAFLTELEGEPRAEIDSDGRMLLRPHSISVGKFQIERPSRFRAETRTKSEVGKKIPSPLIFFADAYVSLHNADYDTAVEQFDQMAKHYRIEGQEFSFVMPYFAFASAKSGDTLKFESFIDSLPKELQNFDFHLAKAFFTGLNGDTNKAVKHLNIAFNQRPHTDFRPIFTEYQYAEACYWLYQQTKENEFRELALDWAGKHQRIQPFFGWAYAMEAVLTESADDRIRALGITLYLNRNSSLIKEMSKADLDKAEQWLQENNPFLNQNTNDGDGKEA